MNCTTKRLAICFTVALSLTWIAAPLSAVTFHVTPQDDWIEMLGGPGFLQPGDEMVFGAGIYNPGNPRLSIKYRGTAENPITLRAAEGANVVFSRDNATQNVQNVINLEGAQYLTIKGLEVTGGSRGITIGNDGTIPSKFITLEGNHIHHTGGAAIAANNDGDTYEGMHFLRNEINNTDGKGEGFYLGCNNNACQFFDGIIEQNYIHDLVDTGNPSFDFDGDGIELKDGSYNNSIRDNVIVNTNFPGILVYGVEEQGARNIIERNVLWDIQNHGIQTAADAIVRNNIVFSATQDGIHIQDHQGAVPGNLDIINNTVRANVGSIETGFAEVHNAIRINPPAAFSGPILLANNALYVDGHGDAIRMFDPPVAHPVTSINNIGFEDGTWDTTVLPFDPTGNLSTDFSDFLNLNAFPLIGSKLIGAGDASNQPSDDFNTTLRNGTNDVGAYAFSANGNPGWQVAAEFKEFPTTGTLVDFDNDGDVDGSDFLLWQQGFGSAFTAEDLTNWEASYGLPLTFAASLTNSVPEPTTSLLLFAGMTSFSFLSRRLAI